MIVAIDLLVVAWHVTLIMIVAIDLPVVAWHVTLIVIVAIDLLVVARHIIPSVSRLNGTSLLAGLRSL